MYKVVKKTDGVLTSKDVRFVYEKEYVVSKDLFDYLKKTFPNDFEFKEEKEKQVEKQETKKRSRKRVVNKDS